MRPKLSPGPGQGLLPRCGGRVAGPSSGAACAAVTGRRQRFVLHGSQIAPIADSARLAIVSAVHAKVRRSAGSGKWPSRVAAGRPAHGPWYLMLSARLFRRVCCPAAPPSMDRRVSKSQRLCQCVSFLADASGFSRNRRLRTPGPPVAGPCPGAVCPGYAQWLVKWEAWAWIPSGLGCLVPPGLCAIRAAWGAVS